MKMKKEEPLVSVIMPSYNHEKYIEEAIRSVWEQTYKNIELIVIDDGSKDSSVAIINRLSAISPIPMKVIVKANEGVCKTLNLGIKISSGKYISGLASDDRYLKNKFELLVPIIEASEENVSFVFSKYQVIREDGCLIDLTSKIPQIYCKNLFEDILLFKSFPSLSSSLIKKNILIEVGQFNERYKFEDYDLMLRLTRGHKSILCNNVTFEYRVGMEGSLSKNVMMLHKDILSIFDENIVYSPKIQNWIWRNYAYGRLYSQVSEFFYRSYDLKLTRTWALKSMRINPFQYRPIRLYIRSLLGKKIINFFRVLLNPKIC